MPIDREDYRPTVGSDAEQSSDDDDVVRPGDGSAEG